MRFKILTLTLALFGSSFASSIASAAVANPKSIYCEGHLNEKFRQIQIFNNGRFWVHDPLNGSTVEFFTTDQNGVKSAYKTVWTDVPARGEDPFIKNYIFSNERGESISVRLFYNSTAGKDPSINIVLIPSGLETRYSEDRCELVPL